MLKPFLFLLPPEYAHHYTVKALQILNRYKIFKVILHKQYALNNNNLEREVMGYRFKNPIGLAAGFDKNGELIEEFETLGFGFIEIGTVTPLAQSGNPKPRLFRLQKDEALINRMGFNNDGLKAMVERLKSTKRKTIIIGGNIGKNKLTPNGLAVSDYKQCFEALFPYVDYFAVNVSSPNTPNLRQLQEKEPLTNLLSQLQVINYDKHTPKPILLKVSPDLTKEQLLDIVEIIKTTKINGVIATNTTIKRDGLLTDSKKIAQIGPGGLSGKIIADRSTNAIKFFRSQLGSSYVIIGVGGIDSVVSAKEKLNAGADLIQLYSGLVYKGPGLLKKILKEL